MSSKEYTNRGKKRWALHHLDYAHAAHMHVRTSHIHTTCRYQCAKKLWALHHLDYAHALVLDSDFELLSSVSLPHLVEQRKVPESVRK